MQKCAFKNKKIKETAKIIDQILVGVFNYLTTRSVFQKQEHTMIERAKMRIQEQKNKRDSKNYRPNFSRCIQLLNY